jgi:hypothetical protein
VIGERVVGLVGANRSHRHVDPGQQAGQFRAIVALVHGQCMCRDLARRGVDRQVQLAPDPAFVLAVQPDLPRAFAKDFEASGIDGQM